jgi:hypothetical protein
MARIAAANGIETAPLRLAADRSSRRVAAAPAV